MCVSLITIKNLSGRELVQTSEDGKGQGGQECCSPWGHKELDTTWQLNNNLTKTTLQINTLNLDITSIWKMILL